MGEGEESEASDSHKTSRARKKRATLELSVAERVAHIVQLMSSGRYEGAATRLELMDAWGCSETVVKQAAAEAHRQLTADPEEMARQKASLASFCGRMREQAATDRNNVTGLADVQAALKAAELQAKFLSIEIEPAKKLELAGKNGGPITVSLAEISEALDAAQSNTADDDSKPDAGSEAGDPAGVR